MRTRLRIKGKRLWMLCGLVLLAVLFEFCHIKITNVTMPTTAQVGDVVPITLDIDVACNSGGTDNLVLCVLMPKGWKGAQNITGTYNSIKGSGNMVLTPTTTIAPNSNGLNWPDYAKKTFGIAGNLIDDMEWVALQTDAPITYANGDHITGSIKLKLKVGADGNPTVVKLAYVVANTSNGFTSDGNVDAGYGATAEYYNEFISNDCFTVTGGTGDLEDFCNPQLTVVTPAKSLDNDFITITFNSNVITTGLSGGSEIHLCAVGTTSDGQVIKVCDQSAKTLFTPAGGGLYQITLWPRSFFGLSGTQTLTKMTYYLTDKTGTVQVGYGGDQNVPFSYTFKCG